MGVVFVSASSQCIKNTAANVITTGYPISFGCWFMQLDNAVSHGTVIGVAASGSVSAMYVQVDSGANGLTLSNVAAGSGINSVAGNRLPQPGIWCYCVARFISATNYRLSWLNNNTLTVVTATATLVLNHVQGTTSRAPSGLNTFCIGRIEESTPQQPLSGMVAEAWWADVDIQPDGGQLADDTIYQLAYGGPFSLPHIAKDIVEYRALRSHITSTELDDSYSRTGPTTWTAVGTPTLGPHPPLAANYTTHFYRFSRRIPRIGELIIPPPVFADFGGDAAAFVRDVRAVAYH